MLSRIVEWSLQNKLLVLVVSLMLAVAGVYSIGQMPLDALPDLFGEP